MRLGMITALAATLGVPLVAVTALADDWRGWSDGRGHHGMHHYDDDHDRRRGRYGSHDDDYSYRRHLEEMHDDYHRRLQDEDGRRPRMGRRGYDRRPSYERMPMPGMMHGMGRAVRMMETYDADKDGRVTQEEVDAFRADRLAKFDADGDGALSLAEYQALWLDAMRDRMVDRFQRHDDDGDGRITADEFSSDTRGMVAMGDRDGDGVLSYGDLGPRGGDEFRHMRDDRRMRRGGGAGMMTDEGEPASSEETEDESTDTN